VSTSAGRRSQSPLLRCAPPPSLRSSVQKGGPRDRSPRSIVWHDAVCRGSRAIARKIERGGGDCVYPAGSLRRPAGPDVYGSSLDDDIRRRQRIVAVDAKRQRTGNEARAVVQGHHGCDVDEPRVGRPDRAGRFGHSCQHGRCGVNPDFERLRRLGVADLIDGTVLVNELTSLDCRRGFDQAAAPSGAIRGRLC
jgi:hypothetical protein